MCLRTFDLVPCKNPQVEAKDAQQMEHEQQLSSTSAEKAGLQSQLEAADNQILVTDTQLQASRLNMRYLKVRQQLSQAAPVLSYVQAYEVSCGTNSRSTNAAEEP